MRRCSISTLVDYLRQNEPVEAERSGLYGNSTTTKSGCAGGKTMSWSRHCRRQLAASSGAEWSCSAWKTRFCAPPPCPCWRWVQRQLQPSLRRRPVLGLEWRSRCAGTGGAWACCVSTACSHCCRRGDRLAIQPGPAGRAGRYALAEHGVTGQESSPWQRWGCASTPPLPGVSTTRARPSRWPNRPNTYRELQFGLRAAVGTRNPTNCSKNKQLIDEVVGAHVARKLAGFGPEIGGAGVQRYRAAGRDEDHPGAGGGSRKGGRSQRDPAPRGNGGDRSLLNTAKVMGKTARSPCVWKPWNG